MLSFADWLKHNDRRERTITDYGASVGRFCAWLRDHRHIPDPVPADVSRIDLADYREFLRQHGRASATINTYLAALETWLDWAVATNQRLDNPAHGLRRIKQHTDTAPKALERKAVGRLLTAVGQGRHPVRDTAIVTLFLQTGLRLEELTNLTWGDLTIQERSGVLAVRDGKGQKARTIPLSVDVRKALWLYLQHDVLKRDQLDYRLTPSAIRQMHPWIATNAQQHVFYSQKGNALSGNAVWRMIHQAGERAGIADLHPHMLRHTFATQLVENGVPVTVIAGLMGHSTITTTQIYTKPNEEALQRAIETLSWE